MNILICSTLITRHTVPHTKLMKTSNSNSNYTILSYALTREYNKCTGFMSDVRSIFLAHISINDIRYDFNGKNQREYM